MWLSLRAKRAGPNLSFEPHEWTWRRDSLGTQDYPDAVMTR